MDTEKNEKFYELEKVFKKHLKEQYKRGLKIGSKTFVKAVKNMIENEQATTKEILEFCNKALGENENSEQSVTLL